MDWGDALFCFFAGLLAVAIVTVSRNLQRLAATPERFELRDAKTRRTVGDRIEAVSGLRAGARIVARGTEKMPRS